MLKAYKYRLYPTNVQKTLLEKHFGCARWIYNWALAEKMGRYSEAGISVSVYELSRQLPELKEREDARWLSEVGSQSLIAALFNLDAAYTRFFRDKKGFPNFKSRHETKQSFQFSQGAKADFGIGRVNIPKFREGIKCNFTRTFEGKIKTTTVSRNSAGKYFISILVDDGKAEPKAPESVESSAIGLDFGLKNIVVTSEGQRFDSPKALQKSLKRLARAQRKMAHRKKGSNNRTKAKKLVAAIHERISNVRKDHLHKLSHTLVCENQATTLCIEDLAVKDMIEKSPKPMNRAIGDVSWSELRRQLEYKCKWYGKNLRVIGRFEPSSKMCSKCGTIHSGLKLADREWDCKCGAHHDRDVNAAINIRKMAFREQNTSSKPFVPEGIRDSKPVERGVCQATKQECVDLVIYD